MINTSTVNNHWLSISWICNTINNWSCVHLGWEKAAWSLPMEIRLASDRYCVGAPCREIPSLIRCLPALLLWPSQPKRCCTECVRSQMLGWQTCAHGRSSTLVRTDHSPTRIKRILKIINYPSKTLTQRFANSVESKCRFNKFSFCKLSFSKFSFTRFRLCKLWFSRFILSICCYVNLALANLP